MFIRNNEYGEDYTGYIANSNGIPLKNLFRAGLDEVTLLLKNLSDEEALFRYEDGKWSVKEVFGHIIDTERIFCYRALAIARGDSGLRGFDQDQYVESAGFDRLSTNHLLKLYQSNRNATSTFFDSLSVEEMLRRGTVSGNECTVRGLGYVITGHEIHHLNLLSERYLVG